MKHYVFRTTTDKLPEHVDKIQADGDVVVSSHYVGERSWVLLCTHGEPTVADLTARQLQKTIRDGVAEALRVHAARPAARR